MQAIIAKCLEELVREKFGREHWNRVLERSGLGPGTIFAGNADISDETIVTVMRHTCAVLEITPLEVAEAFKDYWSHVFAPKLYRTYHHPVGEVFRKRNAASGMRRAKPMLMH
jgi:hypothetical protein